MNPTGNGDRRPWLRAANAGQLGTDAATVTPLRPAILADGFELTYAALEERTRRVTGMLRGLGVRPGDVVALALGNDWRFAECFLGVLCAGARVLLPNTRLGDEALAYVVDHSGATVLVAHESLSGKVTAIRTGAPGVRTTLAIGEIADAEPYDVLVENATPDPVVHAVEPDDVAVLMYTSGSTGRPKGCLLSHSNTWWQARSSARTMLLDHSDRYLVMGPLYHANALWAGLLPMLYAGGSVVVLPDFDAGRALDAIERHEVTYLSGTPSMFTLLLAEAARRGGARTESLQLVKCGSAPVPAELMRRLTEGFGCQVVETYGLTEGGANVLTPRWGIKKTGSTGLPVPDVEIRVVDPDGTGRECAPGEVGELWSRSPANALGYLRLPEATAARFRADGWLRTGDLVRRDDQGYVYFCGRVDDMISVGGENVYPKEVENLLLLHPAVADVAVVAAAHPVKGQAPVAWVVLEPGSQASEGELRRYALAHGPAYAHPRRVVFRESLPVSGTNKLDRKALEHATEAMFPDGVAPTPDLAAEPHGRQAVNDEPNDP